MAVPFPRQIAALLRFRKGTKNRMAEIEDSGSHEASGVTSIASNATAIVRRLSQPFAELV